MKVFLKLSAFPVFLLLMVLLPAPAKAMFMRVDVQEAPLDRVFTNLYSRLAANTNDLELTCQLARLHSMACSTNYHWVEVAKSSGELPHDPYWTGVLDDRLPATNQPARILMLGHLTNAISLYQRSAILLKTHSTESQREEWTLRVHLGLAWCLDQAGRRAEAIEAYRKVVKMAWAQEVAVKLSFSAMLKGAFDDVRSLSNPFHKRQVYFGPGPCFSEEAIQHLLVLLNPQYDAAEIAQLQKKASFIASAGRAYTPILIPLTKNVELADLVDPTAAVPFDLDGSGLQRRWGWITPKAGWLVHDPQGRGNITSALQMFGNVTFWIFWRDGYDALSSLDDNGDGVISGKELVGLAIWRDVNTNGISEPGEVRPLSEYGITALRCHSAQRGPGGPWQPQGVQFQDGHTAPTYDWVSPSIKALADTGK